MLDVLEDFLADPASWQFRTSAVALCCGLRIRHQSTDCPLRCQPADGQTSSRQVSPSPFVGADCMHYIQLRFTPRLCQLPSVRDRRGTSDSPSTGACTGTQSGADCSLLQTLSPPGAVTMGRCQRAQFAGASRSGEAWSTSVALHWYLTVACSTGSGVG